VQRNGGQELCIGGIKMIKQLGAIVLGTYMMIQAPAQVDKPKMEYESLSRRNIVDIVAEYDIKRVPIIPMPAGKDTFSMIMGLTFEEKQEMVINKILNDDLIKYTIIHEMMHVKYNKKGFADQDEAVIEDFGCRAWKDIYEKPCPDATDLDKVINSSYLKKDK
jgi:hypothetical protein